MLDQSRAGPILTGDKTDLGDGPPITAMLVQNMNYWLRVSRSRMVGLPMVKANFMVLRMTRPVMRSCVRKWWR